MKAENASISQTAAPSFTKLSAEAVLTALAVDPHRGLSAAQVSEKQAEGLNVLTAKKKTPWILRFLAQFKDVLVLVLLLAAGISVAVDRESWIESVIILAIVLLNALIGVTQESKAEKSLEALKQLSTPHVKVLRDGEFREIPSAEVVVGDIMEISAGDFVCADARIIECNKLKIDESALTGESLAVNKHNRPIEKDHVALGDQKNMLFSSTFITYGRGLAVVTATGMNTEVGKIATLLQETKEEATPLQVKLDQIGKYLGFGAIGICAVIFLIEFLLLHERWIDALKSSVALAVAAIPEGLSAIVTVVLAIGVQKMVKEHAIVKKLPAVETLGSTSVICSDKTGTLTQNKMTVVRLYRDGFHELGAGLPEQAQELLAYYALCSNAQIIQEADGAERRIGDPTETALVEANNKYGLGDQIAAYPRLGELSFDSERKMMSVVVNYKGKNLVIVKGAPDVLLAHCKNKAAGPALMAANKEMGESALRVLGLAVKEIATVPAELEYAEIENELEYLGLVGMIDPARPEVKGAIAVAKKAGMRTIMITGDHIATATAIARELGIMEPGMLAITSSELHALSDAELFENIEKYAVYARVAPEDKVRIVDAWQKKGKVVAMTGDGVNDSPALKAADIGCAMGITGTDVAKEASAMILTDDNFATIVTAVKEGRAIFNNIRKTVHYLLSSNIGEVLTIFVASLIAAIGGMNLGLPLLPIHLLWINLITDSLPAFGIGMEKADETLMDNPPRPKKAGFFAEGVGINIVWQGLIVGALALSSYLIGWYFFQNKQDDGQIAHTMAFLTLATLQLFHAYNLKGDHSFFNFKKTLNNKVLNIAFLVGFGLQMLIIYVPAFDIIFKLEPLTLAQLAIAIGLAFAMVIVMEGYKLIRFLRKRAREKAAVAKEQ